VLVKRRTIPIAPQTDMRTKALEVDSIVNDAIKPMLKLELAYRQPTRR
jgi:hypothetical protein